MRFLCLVILAASTTASASTRVTYKTVEVVDNQLFITTRDGTKIAAPKIKGQDSFESPAVSSSGRTVAWLVDFTAPEAGVNYPMSGAVAIYRSGRIIRTLTDPWQVIWDWRFADSDSRIAYCSGPTHGGAKECKLVDGTSGRTLARWVVSDNAPPDWAKGLRY
jgi:hypothetical protein